MRDERPCIGIPAKCLTRQDNKDKHTGKDRQANKAEGGHNTQQRRGWSQHTTKTRVVTTHTKDEGGHSTPQSRGWSQHTTKPRVVTTHNKAKKDQGGHNTTKPRKTKVVTTHSSQRRRRVGGIATLVRKSLVPHSSYLEYSALILDRIARLAVRFEASSPHQASDAQLVFYGGHNFGSSVSELSFFRNTYKGDCDWARSPHLGNPIQVFVMGDFNYDAPREAKCHIDTPDFDDVAPPVSVRFPQSDYTVLGGVSIRSHSWQHLFEDSVELAQPPHTYFNVSASLTSRVDRCYVCAPQWAFVRRTIQSCISVPPKILHVEGISDHSPLLVQTLPSQKQMKTTRRATYFESGLQVPRVR